MLPTPPSLFESARLCRWARIASIALAALLLIQGLAVVLTKTPAIDGPPAVWIPGEIVDNATGTGPGSKLAEAEPRGSKTTKIGSTRSAVTLRIRAVDETGAPLSGIRMLAKSAVSSNEAESDADGYASMVVPAGRPLTLAAAGRGFELIEMALPAQVRETERLFEMHRTPPLRGRVVDEAGEPVIGAEVSLFAPRAVDFPMLQIAMPEAVETTSSGEFFIASAPRRGVLARARKPGYVPIESDLGSARGALPFGVNDAAGHLDSRSLVSPPPHPVETDALHLCLSRAGSIEGVVRDTSGRPVQRATVVLVDLDGFTGPAELRTTAETGNDGGFQMNEVPPGRRLAVRVRAKSGHVDGEPITVAPCETAAVELTVPADNSSSRRK